MAMGARCVEVHVTMSHEMFGPDVGASVTTSELAELVKGVHFVNEMRHCEIDKEILSDETLKLRRTFSKSLYVNRDVKAGEILKAEDIGIKKPHDDEAMGVGDYAGLIGKKILIDLKKDEAIKQEYVK